MSKAQGLHRYLRTISRKLVCYKDTKQTLLEGLEQELSIVQFICLMTSFVRK